MTGVQTCALPIYDRFAIGRSLALLVNCYAMVCGALSLILHQSTRCIRPITMAGVVVPDEPHSLNLRRVHPRARVRFLVALLEKLSGHNDHGFGDASPKGVVVELAITLHQQAVAFDFAVAAALAVVALAEQVARRVVGEVFDVVDEAEDFGEAVEGVVGVAFLTFTAVAEQPEVAVGVVLVAAPVVVVAGDFAVLVQRVDTVFLEAVLFVVVVFAEHRALLAHDFAPVFKAVAGEIYWLNVVKERILRLGFL